MKHYDKLVRDRIPEIIEANGERCTVRRLTDAEYAQRLDEKLAEELTEYRESGDVEELADLVELVQAIVVHRGMSWEAFEQLRATSVRSGVGSVTGCCSTRCFQLKTPENNSLDAPLAVIPRTVPSGWSRCTASRRP